MSSKFRLVIIVTSITLRMVLTGPDENKEDNGTYSCSVVNVTDVVVPEDVKLGYLIFCAPGNGNFQIQSGNTHNRFKELTFENGTSCIAVAAYLDYDTEHIYNLRVVEHIYSLRVVEQKEYINCTNDYILTISIEDSPKWPPHFNSSCHLPNTRTTTETWPIPMTVRIPGNGFGHQYKFDASTTYVDLDNDLCIITVYRGQQPNHILRPEELNRMSVYCKDGLTGVVTRVESHFYRTDGPFPEEVSGLVDVEKLRKEYAYLHIGSLNVYHFFAENWPTLDCYAYDPVLGSNIIYIPDVSFVPLGCPLGKYGGLCQFDCICQNGATCHTFNGACKCAEGYKGVACEIEVPYVSISPGNVSVVYGQLMSVKCSTVGIYKIANFFGLYNGNIVQYFSFRPNATWHSGIIQIDKATERNTGLFECRVIDFEGNIFNAIANVNISGCPKNYWGENCSNICNCLNDGVCDRYDGCRCGDGWTGKTCTEVCLKGWYGPNCQLSCQCENGAECDVKDGSCSCTGNTCGTFCRDICSCDDPLNTPLCNVSNVCICQEGVTNYKFTWYIVIAVPVSVTFVTVIVCLALQRKRKNMATREYVRLPHMDVECEQMIQELRENQTVIKYEVPRSHLKLESSDVIGKGEYGQVKRAELVDDKGRKTVAVKTFNEGKARWYNYRDFCHEVETLIKVKDHENIIDFIGVILSEGPKYIIVEYAVLGDLLGHLVTLRGWQVVPVEDEERLLHYAKCVVRALEFLHEKKIIHRDVAARNVLLIDHFVAKLGDFGLSRNTCSTNGGYEKVPWDADQGPLPLKWMPVEFLNQGIFKPEGDIWSFGVLMWEIATLGETPFPNVDALDFYRRLRNGERLERTRRCTEAGYNLMRSCWKSPLQLRPKPVDLLERLDELLLGVEGLFVRQEKRELSATV